MIVNFCALTTNTHSNSAARNAWINDLVCLFVCVLWRIGVVSKNGWWRERCIEEGLRNGQ
jgi:hypothetical protein